MTKYLIAVLLLILAGYGAREAMPLISGPSLTVTSPADGETVKDGIVTISGHEARSVALSLDGAPLLPEQDGSFSSKLAFAAGTSVLTFKATDRFGKSVTVRRLIYVP